MSITLRIGASAVATAVAFALCEVAARVVLPAPPDPTREPQIVYRADPEIRYTLAANQRGWIDDGFVTTNSSGFRGREVELPKPARRFRVLALGDSVTFGWGVNDAETFASQLEQLLRASRPGFDAEVVNLAVPGYDTFQEVQLLKRSAARLQPDLVLVGFYSNDVPDALGDKDPAAAVGTTVATNAQAGQVLHMNPAPPTWWGRQLRKSRAIYTAGHAVKRMMHRGEAGKSGASLELDLLEGRESSELDRAWARVSAQLEDLHGLATELGFSVGVVILPPREQVMGLYGAAPYQPKLRAIAERLNFLVIDPLPSLASHEGRKASLFIPYDRNHPSAAGHRAIALAIAAQLERHDEVLAMSRPVSSSDRAQ